MSDRYPCCFRFYLDKEEIKRISPGDRGFWGFGNYDNDMPGLNNPWKEGNKMAPFDKEVKKHGRIKCKLYICILNTPPFNTLLWLIFFCSLSSPRRPRWKSSLWLFTLIWAETHEQRLFTRSALTTLSGKLFQNTNPQNSNTHHREGALAFPNHSSENS